MKKFFTKETAIKIATLAVALVVVVVPALAADPPGFTGNLTVPTLLTNILRMMMYAFQAIGAVTIIFGAVQMGFAFKNDDADGKTKGMRAALSGAIVFAIGMAGVLFFGTGQQWWQ